MDEMLAKYRELRADLDRPVTVRTDVAQAFREVYDAATKVVIERDSLQYQLEQLRAGATLTVAGSDMAELRRMLQNEKPPATDNGLLSDEG